MHGHTSHSTEIPVSARASPVILAIREQLAHAVNLFVLTGHQTSVSEGIAGRLSHVVDDVSHQHIVFTLTSNLVLCSADTDQVEYVFTEAV